MVYSDDELARPLFGVYLRYETDLRGNRTGLRVNVYTDSLIARYRCAQAAAIREPLESVPHYFGAVPLTEYWNNACERGDFERVLPLIDAYDLLQSDRVNDKQQFADALLVLTGVMGLTAPEDGDGRTPGERLRQDKTLALPDSTARVEWLTKETHESDADVLRRALSEDIHKFSMVPDLTDEQFAANASGVAMRYKLLGLEQLTGREGALLPRGPALPGAAVRPLPGAAGRKGDRARARALHLHPFAAGQRYRAGADRARAARHRARRAAAAPVVLPARFPPRRKPALNGGTNHAERI